MMTDPMEFYCQNDVNSKSSDNSTDTTKCKRQISVYQITVCLTGLSIALIILILAVLVHQLLMV